MDDIENNNNQSPDNSPKIARSKGFGKRGFAKARDGVKLGFDDMGLGFSENGWTGGFEKVSESDEDDYYYGPPEHRTLGQHTPPPSSIPIEAVLPNSIETIMRKRLKR